MRIPLVGLILAGGLALSGCASNGLYSGVSVGTGFGYGSYGYGGYGYPYSRFGSPYWGWYDGFYYPGTGFYVYDRWSRPFYWNDRYRRYWTDRRDSWQRRSGTVRPVWEDFGRALVNRRTTARSQQRTFAVDSTPSVQTRARTRTQRIERTSPRSERAQTRRARRIERDDRP